MPAEIPETVPRVDEILAIEGLLLDHVPPTDASVMVVEALVHIEVAPDTAAGKGLTVIAWVV
jgi:hypothetical protein